ncbi:MAG: hypothetical protein KDD43_16035, partial [Bdellovibrionales bacterium]|nr:hypothetical protein [Bdellovibrionales bacterium]
SAQLHKGDILWALTINKLEAAAEAKVMGDALLEYHRSLLRIIKVALIPNYTWFGLFILAGLVWFGLKKPYRLLLVLLLIPAIPKYWSVLSFAIPSDPRYLFTFTCLFWPLGFFLFKYSAEPAKNFLNRPMSQTKISLGQSLGLVLVISLLGIALWQLPLNASWLRRYGFSQEFLRAAQVIKEHRQPSEIVLAEISHSNHCGFMVKGGVPGHLYRMPPPPTYFNQKSWQGISVPFLLDQANTRLGWIVIDPKGEVLPKTIRQPEFFKDLEELGMELKLLHPPSEQEIHEKSFRVYKVLHQRK